MITHEESLHNFSQQLQYALAHFTPHGVIASEINNIVMGGLGGSGIGAFFTKNFFYTVSNKSIEVVSDYHLPQYVNDKTLVVLASYSGDTEETLSLFNEALSANAKIIVISSGGTLGKLCKEHNVKCYELPKGYQPRMAFGFSYALNTLIIGELFDLSGIKLELSKAIDHYANQTEWKNSAKEILNYFKDHLKNKFVVVADRSAQPIATRFAQQVQENAKLETFVQVLPENNHNALETYYSKLSSNIILLNGCSNARVNLRFDFLKGKIEGYQIPFASIVFDGNILSEIFKTVYILDHLSIMLSNEVKADNMKVDNISELKDFLTANQ